MHDEFDIEPNWVGRLAVWHHRVEKPRARVLLIHGISEHSARHRHTVKFLTVQNIEVVRFDMRGAGRSGGKRQWCDHFSDYVDDTDQVYHWICRNADPLPLYVLGHSLGGAIAIHFAAEMSRELDGLMLSGPALIPGGVSPLLIFLGTWTDRIFPSARLPKPLDSGGISRIPEVVQAYIDDPLVCHNNTVHQGAEVMKGLRQIPQLLPSIQCPTVIFHGSEDKVISLAGSFEIVAGLGCAEKSLHVLPGGYHEPHNDLDSENYYRYMELWLNKRLNRETEVSVSAIASKKTKKRTKKSDGSHSELDLE